MLTVKFEEKSDELKPLYDSLNLGLNVSGANFVFYDETQAVGLWRIKFSGNEAVVDAIVFDKNVDKDDKNFFIRAMLYKLQLGAPVLLRIKGAHKEFEIFGFEETDDDMQIMTNEINLHKYCKD